MNIAIRSSVLVASMAFALSGIACGGQEAAPPAVSPSGAVNAVTQMDIVDTAAGAGSFTTLVAAVKAAGLVETLKGAGPFTVFAPTDEAFKKLPAGTLESLLKPENKAKLADILKYHVVAGKVTAEQVVTLTSAKTVLGKEVKITKNAGGVMIDGAKVTKTDIACSNGVIHIIDTVILPQ
jgi:transforming growth factor-beta-induced protein